MKTIAVLVLSLVLSVCLSAKTVLRVGYFPNVTHAQGVIGKTLTAQQKGWFEERLGPDVEIQWYAFNAGPSAMEAIFAGSLDLTYVGPNPSLNAYIRSKGEEIRAIAGAARGGAALLIRKDSGIEKPADFKGKKLATPQLGNTQDVAARVWLRNQGFKITQMGGEVSVLPTANPDQLTLFQQGKIDAVWTVEPWVSRIEREAGGKIYLEQKDAVTTILVSSAKFMKTQPELVKKFARAHSELTEWINSHPEEAQKLVQRGLSEEVKREIKLELIVASWQRLVFTSEIALSSIESLVSDARQLGFIRGEVDLASFISIPK
ncbi:MAG: ABC transporter substrate-binding protein [Nibricoccus sp.]